MVFLEGQQVILNCDKLTAPVDKNSQQFSQLMALAGSNKSSLIKTCFDYSMDNIFIQSN